MDYVQGLSLVEIVRRDRTIRGTDVARMAMGVLRSLREAHDFGIVHRDLKPANVLLVSDQDERHPVARVLDFGIAKLLTDRQEFRDSSGHTIQGKMPCTPRYAAPELLRGRVTPQADIYALGLVMAAMLDGIRPHAALNDYEVIAANLSRDPIELNERALASPLRPIVERAVAKKQADRFQDADEMLAALELVYREMEGSGRVSPVAGRQRHTDGELGGRRRQLVDRAAAGGPVRSGDQRFGHHLDGICR